MSLQSIRAAARATGNQLLIDQLRGLFSEDRVYDQAEILSILEDVGNSVEVEFLRKKVA
jgi:hypothetical protein